MQYALIAENGRLVALSDLQSSDEWGYPEEYTLVEAYEFVPDSTRDLSDYVYIDGELVLDETGIAEYELNRPYEPREVIAALFQQTEILDGFSDDLLAHMAPYMADWQPGASYAVGDKVQYSERPYRCLQPHVSTAEWNPEDAASLWARILPGQGGEIGEWQQPSSTNPYMTGDRVTHNGHTWVSDVDNNVWEPGVYGWTQLD